MMKIIEKVAAIVHYVDGRTDEGFFGFPVAFSGPHRNQFPTLIKEDGVETLVNLNHVISIDQSIIFKG